MAASHPQLGKAQFDLQRSIDFLVAAEGWLHSPVIAAYSVALVQVRLLQALVVTRLLHSSNQYLQEYQCMSGYEV